MTTCSDVAASVDVLLFSDKRKRPRIAQHLVRTRIQRKDKANASELTLCLIIFLPNEVPDTFPVNSQLLLLLVRGRAR